MPALEAGGMVQGQAGGEPFGPSFSARRVATLASLAGDGIDFSRKGSVDAPVQDVVDFINGVPAMYTTSCCSGRVSVFAEPSAAVRAAKKKGGDWVFTSHDPVEVGDVRAAIAARSEGDDSQLVFRFEPFIVHVECCSNETAQWLASLARDAGCRETGVTGTAKFIVGIRCAIRLEVPVAVGPTLLVPDAYLATLVDLANEKFRINHERHRRFFKLLQERVAKGIPGGGGGRRTQENAEGLGWALMCPRLSTKAAKDWLKSAGHLDPGRTARVDEGAGTIALPLMPGAAEALRREAEGGRLPDAVAGAVGGGGLQEVDLAGRRAGPGAPQPERVPAATKGSSEVEAVANQAAQLAAERDSRGGGKAVAAGKKGAGPVVGADLVGWALLCPRLSTKAAKDWLKSAGHLDPGRTARVDAGAGTIALPLMPGAAEALRREAEAGRLPDAVAGAVGGGGLQEVDLAGRRPGVASPAKVMRDAVEALLVERGVLSARRAELLAELPTRWEVLGDLALLPASALPSEASWAPLGAALWRAVAGALRVRRLARQAPVAPNGTRQSRAAMLLGEGGWVEHRENGVLYCLDVTRCMFSSGNVTEKARVARLDCRGQVVVDMFAGIGYYTLPYLVKSGARHVYACDWNPDALAALRHNLRANGVAEGRCTVLEGDVRATHPRGVADRVNLGLIPSSELAWPCAVAALVDGGGTLHVHANVTDRDEADWVEGAARRLEGLAREGGGRRGWRAEVLHVERVKWYAPHVRHIVVDIRLGPPGAAPGGAAWGGGSVRVGAARALAGLGAAAGVAAVAAAARALPGPPSPAAPGGRHAAALAGAAAGVALAAAAMSTVPRLRAALFPEAWQRDGAGAARRWGRVRRVDARGMGRAAFAPYYEAQQPVVLEGVDVGAAPERWTPDYLARGAAGDRLVSAHVSHSPELDFVTRNFVFKVMPLRELVARAAGCPPGEKTPPPPLLQPPGEEEHIYLRAVGANPRKQVAQLAESFPELAADVRLPEELYCGRGGADPRCFSTVLRVSSPGLSLWTHYDVCDNLLVQVVGRKRVVLFPPSEEARLYVEGSSSAVTDVDRPDLRRFPLFAGVRGGVECNLGPGDVLFIPALWFHTVRSEDFSVSVNAFWRALGPGFYSKKDLYGNADLAPAAEAAAAAERAASSLREMPEPYRAFYRRRALALLRDDRDDDDEGQGGVR